MIDWHDIYGFFSDRDAELYLKWADEVPNGATIVELGTLCGRSACCLMTALEQAGKNRTQLVVVDRWPVASPGHKWWEGSDELALLDGDPLTLTRMNLARWKKQVSVVQFDVAAVSKMFLAESVWGVMLDANHTHEATVQYTGEWMPKIVPGGYMGGHDYLPDSYPGLVKAVDDTYGKERVNHYGCCWEVKK